MSFSGCRFRFRGSVKGPTDHAAALVALLLAAAGVLVPARAAAQEAPLPEITAGATLADVRDRGEPARRGGRDPRRDLAAQGPALRSARDREGRPRGDEARVLLGRGRRGAGHVRRARPRLPGHRAPHGARGAHRGERRALEGRSQGHGRAEAVLDPRSRRRPQGREEDQGEVRREGLLPRGRHLPDRRAARQPGRRRLRHRRAREGAGEGGPLPRERARPRRRPPRRDADAARRLPLVPELRRHLPRGGVPARPPGRAGRLPRPRLREREGRDAVGRALARQALPARHHPGRGGRAVPDRRDRLLRAAPRPRADAAPHRAHEARRDLLAHQDPAGPVRRRRRLPRPGLRLRERPPAHEDRPEGAHDRASPSRSSPGKVRFERINIRGNARRATR